MVQILKYFEFFDCLRKDHKYIDFSFAFMVELSFAFMAELW